MSNVLLVKNAKVFNSVFREFRDAKVLCVDGRFAWIGKPGDDIAPVFATHGLEKKDMSMTIDAGGFYMIPGLIDIHMHVESSMLGPIGYASQAIKGGVTTVVAEPHEIANVKGMEGIEAMLAAAENSPIDMYFGFPSSVPSSNYGLETPGCSVDFEDMLKLYQNPKCACVGEIMNGREVIKEDSSLEVSKFLDWLWENDRRFPIEGHCPSLNGPALSKFLFEGIDADHTEHSLPEFIERFENGMFIELQSKTVKQDIIDYIVENGLYERMCFVTDDVMTDRLLHQGALNRVVEKAMGLGFPVEEAIYCATYTPAARMNLRDRGMIAPGRKADFALYEDPQKLDAEYVFTDGELVYMEGDELIYGKQRYAFAGDENSFGRIPQYDLELPKYFPDSFYHTVICGRVSADMLKLKAPEGASEVEVRVAMVSPTTTRTTEERVKLPVKDGCADWKSAGLLLAACFERHGKNGGFGLGLVGGTGMHGCTIGSTYSHDHHNIFLLGDSEKDMACAANRLIEIQGGILTVKDGKVTAELALPVCGIISEDDPHEVGKDLNAVRGELEKAGYTHFEPIMGICTLGLPVSPALKITDKGLIDVKAGKVVPVIVQ